MSDTITATDIDLPSGRFVLRIDPALHAHLRESAGASGISLNELCARKLALPGSNPSGPAAAVIERAVAIVGGALMGVLAFGSWVRDELQEESDVDLMVIVDDTVPVERDLYRRWDASPLSWNGHPVEPHFVHLPPPDAPVSGIWAEVAVEGVVLFERALEVSRRLVEVRREIAAGRIVRRTMHGRSYWVEAV